MPIALGVMAVGAVAQVAGGIMGANAQQNIASAQQAQAQANQQLALSYAAPTAQELTQLQGQIQNQARYQAVQQAGVARDTQILNSLDPALVTAGQQANAMLQGKQAAIIQPMLQQQNVQRQQLQSSLAAQFGPGWASTSAGQQALTNFNMSANVQTQQAQMSAFQQISEFMGFNTAQATNLQNSMNQSFQTANNMSAQTLQGMNTIQERQEQAVLGTNQAKLQTAGSQYAGDAATANMISGLGKTASSIGGMMGGQAMGGGSSASSLAPSGGSATESASSGQDMLSAMGINQSPSTVFQATG